MKRKKGGFTLVEIMLVVALIGVAAVFMYTFFGQGFALYTVETASVDDQMNMRQVLSDITNKARLSPDDIAYESGVLSVGDTSYVYDGEQVLRNGTAIASGIAAFDVQINQDILEIAIANTSGDQISTALSLAQ